jgi:hypothetical protein
MEERTAPFRRFLGKAERFSPEPRRCGTGWRQHRAAGTVNARRARMFPVPKTNSLIRLSERKFWNDEGVPLSEVRRDSLNGTKEPLPSRLGGSDQQCGSSKPGLNHTKITTE